MTWRDEWRGFRARVQALNSLGAWFPGMATGNLRTHAEMSVTSEAARIKADLDAFFARHKAELPSGAEKMWRASLGFHGAVASGTTMTFDGVGAIPKIVCLTGFAAEFDALVASPQPSWASRTERALQHLNRLLAVRAPLASEWTKAFKKGETELEKLGAVHLLQHGLFAVKVNASGGRTDLVVPDRPVAEMDEDAVSANTPFVLTEWKRVRTEGEFAKATADATTQLTRYGEGVLADFTLRETRFMVLVSHGKSFRQSPVTTAQGWTLRCFNVVIDPPSPSKDSLA